MEREINYKGEGEPIRCNEEDIRKGFNVKLYQIHTDGVSHVYGFHETSKLLSLLSLLSLLQPQRSQPPDFYCGDLTNTRWKLMDAAGKVQ